MATEKGFRAQLKISEEHMLTYFLINLGDLMGSFVLERHLEGCGGLFDRASEGWMCRRLLLRMFLKVRVCKRCCV
jgi:hypothetical protein